jgi:hypothetical protein
VGVPVIDIGHVFVIMRGLLMFMQVGMVFHSIRCIFMVMIMMSVIMAVRVLVDQGRVQVGMSVFFGEQKDHPQRH